MITAESGETYVAGGVVEAGTYKCRGCGLRIGFDGLEEVPRCPACGETRFRRAPLFDRARAVGSPAPTLEETALGETRAEPAWLAGVRARLADGERYVAFEQNGEVRVARLPVGWSRVGRAVTSDIRLDDPTVSRRHALLVRSAGGEVRLLDDRSLNGVRVNGETVEWGTLADGDELGIGRFRLYVVALEPAGSRSSESSAPARSPAPGSRPGSERAARSS